MGTALLKDYGYWHWQAKIIKCIKGEFYYLPTKLRKLNHLNPASIVGLKKVSLILGEQEKIQNKQKEVFEQAAIFHGHAHKKGFSQDLNSSKNIFTTSQSYPSSMKDFLFNLDLSNQPSSQHIHNDFGHFRFSNQKVKEVQNAVRTLGPDTDYSDYHPKYKKLYKVPGNHLLIETKSYLIFLDWCDTINSLINRARMQILARLNLKKTNENVLHYNLSVLELYFNENLHINFENCFLELKNIEGLTLDDDFDSKMQLHFITGLLEESYDFMAKYLLNHPGEASCKTVVLTYKQIHKMWCACSAQSRRYLTQVGYEKIRIDNNKVKVLLNNFLTRIRENHDECLSDHIWTKNFKNYELTILEELSDLQTLLRGKRKSQQTIDNIVICSQDFRNDMFQLFETFYPSFVVQWNKEKKRKNFDEQSFIEYIIEHINKSHLNFQVKNSIVIHHASSSKQFSFDLYFYNTFLSPIFQRIKDYLVDKSNVSGNKKKKEYQDNYPVIHPLYFYNHFKKYSEGQLRRKLKEAHQILIKSKWKGKTCIPEDSDALRFINACLNPSGEPFIRWLWAYNDFRFFVYTISMLISDKENDFWQAAANIFTDKHGNKFNIEKLKKNSEKLVRDKFTILNSAIKPLH